MFAPAAPAGPTPTAQPQAEPLAGGFADIGLWDFWSIPPILWDFWSIPPIPEVWVRWFDKWWTWTPSGGWEFKGEVHPTIRWQFQPPANTPGPATAIGFAEPPGLEAGQRTALDSLHASSADMHPDTADTRISTAVHWYDTDEPWYTAESNTRTQTTPPAASTLPQQSSAAQPACEKTPAQKFLDALDDAAYQRDDDDDDDALDNKWMASRLRELADSLYSGKLLNLWHVDEEERRNVAIAKLDQLIKLVVNIRTAWFTCPESKNTRKVPERRLGPLKGYMSEEESKDAAHKMLKSMSKEERAEYNFCFQTSGSRRFFIALVSRPSILNAEHLSELLEHWAVIKNSSEYQTALEHNKKRSEHQINQTIELQKLRIQISRLRRKRQDTTQLEEHLRNKLQSLQEQS